MDIAGRLPAQEWYTEPDTVHIMRALMTGGSPARFVGGCVRDAILGLPIYDIDIATPEPPERVMKLLQKSGIRVEPIGIEHGSVMAIAGGRGYDITTLRSDVETFGRHARVSYIDNWQEDAARRDFTMNAIYADLDGTLYDPTGGMADLEAGRVRFIGDAYQRIREDCLRILRFFRFQAYYGREAPTPEDLKACEQEAAYLRSLSSDRIWTEFKRLLSAPDPAAVLLAMQQHQVLPVILPNASTQFIPRLIELEKIYHIKPNAARRLSCLVIGPVDNIRQDLPVSRQEYNHLMTLQGITPDLSEDFDIYRTLYYHGVEIFQDHVLLRGARGQDIQNLINKATTWASPELPIRGQDLLDAGIPPGPNLGERLQQVTNWWLSQSCRPNREECLAWVLGGGEFLYTQTD